MLLQREELLFLLYQRLKHADEGHLFIKRSIPKRDRSLAGQDLDHLEMRLAEKIRIAALEYKDANFSFLIQQRHQVARAHAGFSEILAELGARLFAIGVNLVAVLSH